MSRSFPVLRSGVFFSANIALMVVALHGCATAPTMVGRPIAELYQKLGPPDQVLDDPACAGCKIHVYVRDRTRVWQDPTTVNTFSDGWGPATTPGEIHSKTTRRKTIFYADASGIITSVRKR